MLQKNVTTSKINQIPSQNLNVNVDDDLLVGMRLKSVTIWVMSNYYHKVTIKSTVPSILAADVRDIFQFKYTVLVFRPGSIGVQVHVIMMHSTFDFAET